jgi:hypothetical protein
MNTETLNNTRLTELKTKKHEIISKFSNIILNMSDIIGRKFPRSYFGTYKQTIYLLFTEKPKEAIVYFLENIYTNDEYRLKIKKGDDAYFLKQDYESDDPTDAAQVFEFKDLWRSFDDIMKNVVKTTMKKLIDYVEEYVNILSEINKLKDKK